MKTFLSIVITLIFSLSTIAQFDKGSITIVQKFYTDTLKTNYRKLIFIINKNADRVKQLNYSSAHTSDTLFVKETTEYIYENGFFVSLDISNSRELKKNETFKIGDTIFEKKTDYLLKKVYSQNKIIYVARLFSEKQRIPYNELKFIYNNNGNLIEIEEKYNSSEANEEYKAVFDYTKGIVSRITEYKLVEEEWEKEKVWEYDLLTKNNIRKKSKKRINHLILYDQFIKTFW